MNHTPNSAHTASPARTVPLWMWILAVVSVVAVAWGLWRALDNRSDKAIALQANAARPAANLNIRPQEWLTVQMRTLPVGLPITGSLSAIDSAWIKARVPGELRDLQVREGDTVTQGQIIARVDATESEARFRQTKLQADAAQAQVAIAQRQYDNNRALVDKGFISSTALATSSANLQAAQANYAAARAAQDGMRKSLDDTVLRSPIGGQVSRRMVQNGERVNVESPVIEVINPQALELQVQVPVNDSAQVQVGQKATLALRSTHTQEAQSLAATVVRINPSASDGNRAIAVYLQLEPVADASLRPGMYVEGFIQTSSLHSLAVPLTAVRTDQPLPYVQSVQDGVVQHTPLQLGAQSRGERTVWVAVQGLPAGMALLSGQVGAIPAGTRVQLMPLEPLAAPTEQPQPQR